MLVQQECGQRRPRGVDAAFPWPPRDLICWTREERERAADRLDSAQPRLDDERGGGASSPPRRDASSVSLTSMRIGDGLQAVLGALWDKQVATRRRRSTCRRDQARRVSATTDRKGRVVRQSRSRMACGWSAARPPRAPADEPSSSASVVRRTHSLRLAACPAERAATSHGRRQVTVAEACCRRLGMAATGCAATPPWAASTNFVCDVVAGSLPRRRRRLGAVEAIGRGAGRASPPRRSAPTPSAAGRLVAKRGEKTKMPSTGWRGRGGEVIPRWGPTFQAVDASAARRAAGLKPVDDAVLSSRCSEKPQTRSSPPGRARRRAVGRWSGDKSSHGLALCPAAVRQQGATPRQLSSVSTSGQLVPRKHAAVAGGKSSAGGAVSSIAGALPAGPTRLQRLSSLERAAVIARASKLGPAPSGPRQLGGDAANHRRGGETVDRASPAILEAVRAVRSGLGALRRADERAVDLTITRCLPCSIGGGAVQR